MGGAYVTNEYGFAYVPVSEPNVAHNKSDFNADVTSAGPCHPDQRKCCVILREAKDLCNFQPRSAPRTLIHFSSTLA